MAYDAHIHKVNNEKGGFVIGLEGVPYFEGALNNSEVMKLHKPEENYISFYYVSRENCTRIVRHPYLKYHPRREKYTVEMVIKSIAANKPRAVIIDTLNEPFWVAYDYWKIVKFFSNVTFVLAHSGGYLVNDFIKICHFQPNVWIDFSSTQTTLGHLGDKNTGLGYINDAIKYALHAPFCNRVLLGSDYPFCSQEDVFTFYNDYLELLDHNFINLMGVVK